MHEEIKDLKGRVAQVRKVRPDENSPECI